MRRWAAGALALSLTVVVGWAVAQTCSIPGLSGNATLTTQPNTFFPGTANAAAGATSITVGTATGVNSGILPGDLLLILQVQGSDINTSSVTNAYGAGVSAPGVTNTVAFGASGYAGGINGVNNFSGRYEWAVATGGGATFAAGGTINLMSPLVNGYFNRAGSVTQGKQAFQVIRVPQYSGLTLGGGITVQPWDGRTGGVLVLDAVGDINLNGQTITGTGRGFRGAGGVSVGPNCTAGGIWDGVGCQQYASTINPQQSLGGSKGEGIVGTPGRLYTLDPTGGGAGTVVAGTVDGYPNGEASRGAPGNAGGGGNQHNGGGGGGAGGGAGGQGGNTWNSSVAGNFGRQLGGFGGAPAVHSATRWYLGGGGGAGDVGGNTFVAPDASGGAGGALVILRASRVVGGGATVNLNGAPGQASRNTDAAGGGGGGGTLVVAAGAGGLTGALTLNANGGNGGGYNPAPGTETDGPGGGGGGGVLITNVTGITANLNGGAGGGSTTTAGCGAVSNACGAGGGNGTVGSVVYTDPSPGVRVGYECLPVLTVNKITTTPLITTATGATAGYQISISNSGGGARFVSLTDFLPPGWTRAATVPSYTYNPIQPLAANRLSSGAETIAIATSSSWAVGATPLTVPAAASGPTLTWSHFAIAPVVAGVPGAVTVNFVVSIPNTATVGTYHNPAGVSFLDPTRAAASTRTVAPLTHNTANRTSTPYSANTTYNSVAGASPNVGGSQYDGRVAGPTGEDVRLVPDLSISKTAAATVAPGGTILYTLTPRNNGRAIGAQSFAATQATDVLLANVGSVLAASPLTVTDTFPSGVIATNTFAGTGWTCSGTAPAVCTLPDATAYPIAASTNFAALTTTARVTCVGGNGKTNTAVISTAQGETLTANNTGTITTTITPGCVNTTLTVAKTNAVTSVMAGGTTSYTITFANLGPGAANNTVVYDQPSPGLQCTSLACGPVGGAAACPTPSLTNFLSATVGLTIATFPANSTVTFVLRCNVTATGQ